MLAPALHSADRLASRDYVITIEIFIVPRGWIVRRRRCRSRHRRSCPERQFPLPGKLGHVSRHSPLNRDHRSRMRCMIQLPMGKLILRPKPTACASNCIREKRSNSANPLQLCPMKSARGVARLAPSAVNPPEWSFAWAQASASADRHPCHTRSLQPLWQHEPRVPTKICITRAHLFYSAPAGESSVSEITPPTQADRTDHPSRKLLANSGTPAHPPGEEPTRPKSPRARTHSLNTSTIRSWPLSSYRAGSTMGAFAGSAALRSNTPFRVRHSLQSFCRRRLLPVDQSTAPPIAVNATMPGSGT